MREGESRALQLHLTGMQEKVDSQRLMRLTRVDEMVFAINYEGPASFWRRLLCIESHSALHPTVAQSSSSEHGADAETALMG